MKLSASIHKVPLDCCGDCFCAAHLHHERRPPPQASPCAPARTTRSPTFWASSGDTSRTSSSPFFFFSSFCILSCSSAAGVGAERLAVARHRLSSRYPDRRRAGPPWPRDARRARACRSCRGAACRRPPCRSRRRAFCPSPRARAHHVGDGGSASPARAGVAAHEEHHQTRQLHRPTLVITRSNSSSVESCCAPRRGTPEWRLPARYSSDTRCRRRPSAAGSMRQLPRTTGSRT